MVLGRGQRAKPLAVAQHHEADLFAGEELLDQDAPPCFADDVAGQHFPCGGASLCLILDDDDTLASGKPVGLQCDRVAELADGGVHVSRIIEQCGLGGGQAAFHEEVFGKRLAPLQLCGRLRRTNDREPATVEFVRDARDERSFRADDCTVRPKKLGQ